MANNDTKVPILRPGIPESPNDEAGIKALIWNSQNPGEMSRPAGPGDTVHRKGGRVPRPSAYSKGGRVKHGSDTVVSCANKHR